MSCPSLAQFADKLATLELSEREKFDLSWWDTEDPICGTVACAIGWGIKRGWLPGMRLDNFCEPECSGTDRTGMDAVAFYFGITFDTTVRLFGGPHGEEKPLTHHDVVVRIRNYLAE